MQDGFYRPHDGESLGWRPACHIQEVHKLVSLPASRASPAAGCQQVSHALLHNPNANRVPTACRDAHVQKHLQRTYTTLLAALALSAVGCAADLAYHISGIVTYLAALGCLVGLAMTPSTPHTLVSGGGGSGQHVPRGSFRGRRAQAACRPMAFLAFEGAYRHACACMHAIRFIHCSLPQRTPCLQRAGYPAYVTAG